MTDSDTPRHEDTGHETPPPPPETNQTEARVEQRASSRTTTGGRTWSPAQIVAGAIGLFLLVLGAVAILRGGFDSLTGTTVDVLGFEHTTLMGFVDVLVAAVFLAAAASTMSVRGTLTFLGLLSLGFGLVMVIEPDRLSEWFGGGTSLGALYIVIGLVSLLAGWISPTIVQRRTTVQTDQDRTDTDSRQ
jgi:hypothetical protein